MDFQLSCAELQLALPSLTAQNQSLAVIDQIDSREVISKPKVGQLPKRRDQTNVIMRQRATEKIVFNRNLVSERTQMLMHDVN